MDISFETTPGQAGAAINAPAPGGQRKPPLPDDDPRLVALRAAGTALVAAAGLADADTVEVALAMSDEPGWAVVRVAQVVKEA